MRKQYTILDPIDKLFGDPITVVSNPVLVITDTHCPYQNKALLTAAFNIAKQRGVRQLIHAGDLIDGGAYNTQSKHEVVPPIEVEIEHARSVLYTAQAYFNKVYIIPGNHDQYYTKKEKITFDALIHEVILEGLYTSRVITSEYDYIYYGKDVVIGHTQSYNPIAGILASELAMKYGRHALVGHDHGHGYQIAENGKLGISIGAMFMLDRFAYKTKSYNTFPNSALGFVIIKDNKISLFNKQLEETIIGG